MPAEQEWEIWELWNKYEKVAMHFNDLIIRLRTQALAGIAALSALTGFFAKADFGATSHTWQIAGMVFAGLAFVWVAVWILDFGYYNRLLIGSIAAIVVLEKRSQTHKTISANSALLSRMRSLESRYLVSFRRAIGSISLSPAGHSTGWFSPCSWEALRFVSGCIAIRQPRHKTG